MNLIEPIQLHGKFRSEHPALVAGETVVTFGQFVQLVDSAARRLIGLGAKKGDVIGICLQDRLANPVLSIAIYRLGATLLPIDWRLTLAEQTRLIERFGARLVLVEPARQAPAGVATVPIDDSWMIPQARGEELPAPSELDDLPALLTLSSGTTGLPKAVVVTQDQHRTRINYFILASGFRATDRCMSLLPQAFGYGHGIITVFLLMGGTVFLAPPMASAAEAVELAARIRPTVLCLIPSLARALLQLPENPRASFASVRVLLCGSAALHPDERAAMRERLSPHVLEMYGSTGGGHVTAIYAEEQEEHAGSVGRPTLDVEVEIVDQDDRALPRGSVGRLRHRGPGMALGFFGGVPVEDEQFKDGWFYPGDYAYLDEQGYLFLQGRRSEIIIVGGINVFAPEVERALAKHPAVVEAAVVGVPAQPQGEQIVAFLKCGALVERRELIAHCRQLLAAYKIPRDFQFVDELPKSNAGKVLKRRLVEMVPTGEAALALAGARADLDA